MSNLAIDVPKLSEILVNAILAFFIAYATFKWQNRTSKSSWEQELAQRNIELESKLTIFREQLDIQKQHLKEIKRQWTEEENERKRHNGPGPIHWEHP